MEPTAWPRRCPPNSPPRVSRRAADRMALASASVNPLPRSSGRLAQLDRDAGRGVARELPVRHGPAEQRLEPDEVRVLHGLGRYGLPGAWVDCGQAVVLEPHDVVRRDPAGVVVTKEGDQAGRRVAVALVGVGLRPVAWASRHQPASIPVSVAAPCASSLPPVSWRSEASTRGTVRASCRVGSLARRGARGAA